jgi:hypothetical protein
MIKRIPKRAKARDLWLDFGRYIASHPEERFWQALRNWSGYGFIFVSNNMTDDSVGLSDTFYWEGKDK